MMNYWDVLKASKGLYVADSYAMMWGRKISDDGQVYEITGIPPLTFISNGSDLLDYRIYGNTIPTPDNPVEVVGCGERTENLFDNSKKNTQNGYFSGREIYYTGTIQNSTSHCVTEYFALNPNSVYTIITKKDRLPGNNTAIVFYDENKNYISGVPYRYAKQITFTVPESCRYCRMTDDMDENALMLLNGEVVSQDAYIPYGYKIPMTVSDGTNSITTPVYIGSEPLYSGEYVSYREQKIYKMIDDILTPVEPPEPFPAIQTIKGTNILTADTKVQPSEMYIKYKK